VPWDREQTFDTISPTSSKRLRGIDAIDRRDWQELGGRVGRLAAPVVFFSQMAAEEGRFTIAEVLDRINDKLVGGIRTFRGRDGADAGQW